MMTTTHALVGAALGAGVGGVVPELAGPALVAGFVGGALPDADLLGTHRRTLHYPVLGPALAVPVAVVAVVLGTPAATLVAVGVLAAAVHCAMDVFGGGVETRPWEATSDRGVYDHVRGRWIRPRRWVRWAGAPEDLLVAFGASVPALAATTGPARGALVAVLAVSAVFVGIRRRLAAVTTWLFGSTGPT